MKVCRPSLRWYPLSCRNQGAEDEVSQGKDDVEIVEVPFVMHVVMSVEPAEPHRLLKPTPVGHMHAEMEVLVEEVIEGKSRHAPEENAHVEKILAPEHYGGMQTENQRCIPPGEADLFAILIPGEKIGRASTKDPVVDQRVGSKRIRP